MAQWVQHISKQGEKWKVRDCAYNTDYPPRHDWCVETPRSGGIDRYHYLPKSEYIPCDPPEQWEDVTAHCEAGYYKADDFKQDSHKCMNGYGWIVDSSALSRNVLNNSTGYRLRKVRLCWPESLPTHGRTIGDYQWAFVVERRKS